MHRVARFVLPFALALGAGSALASEADREAIRQGCLANMNWTEQACQCLADKAADIEDVQQAFIAAILTKDSAAAAALRPKMTIPQMTQASMFVLNVGPSCQGG